MQLNRIYLSTYLSLIYLSINLSFYLQYMYATFSDIFAFSIIFGHVLVMYLVIVYAFLENKQICS